MSLMAANEESDPSAILNGFWVTLSFINFITVKFINKSIELLEFHSYFKCDCTQGFVLVRRITSIATIVIKIHARTL